MRCPQCSKFVAYEGDEEPEIESSEVRDDGTIAIEVRIVKRCGECGEDLKEAILTIEEALPADFTDDDPAELSIEVDEQSATERYEGKHRPKVFYGAEVQYRIVRENDSESETLHASAEIAASAMDELV